MVVVLVFTEVVVGTTVPVGMRVPMKMSVHHPVVFMGVLMKMPVWMAVLIPVLQGSDSLAAALAERIGQAVEIAKP